MTTYAALTDGTTTITFASPGTLGWYRIETGWAPRIANMRGQFSTGGWEYEDVTEEIPVSIGGSTPAHMYANISALKNLIDSTRRWSAGASVPAVTLKYSPEGATISSAASPLQSLVYDTSLEFGGGYSSIPQSGSAVWSTGNTLRLTRRGLWITTSASGSASGTNGNIVTVAVGSSSYLSPTSVSLTNCVGGRYDAARDNYIIWSNSPSGIVILEAETAASVAAKWTYQDGSATIARGGSFLRYQEIVGATNTSASFALGASTKNFALFANVANSGVSGSAKFSIYIGNGASLQSYMATNPYIAGSAKTWVNLGTFRTSYVPNYLTIYPTILSSSPSLDFDSFVFVDLDTSGIVQTVRTNYSGAIFAETATIDSSYLTSLAPRIYGGSENLSYIQKSSAAISTSSGSVYMLLLQNYGGSGVGGAYYWRSASLGGSPVAVSNTWTVTRYYGYPVPV